MTKGLEFCGFVVSIGSPKILSEWTVNESKERRTVRFGAFMREIGMHQRSIPFSKVTQHGRQHAGKKVGVSSLDIYRIVGPYFSVRTIEQIKAVVPLAIYLGLFQHSLSTLVLR